MNAVRVGVVLDDAVIFKILPDPALRVPWVFRACSFGKRELLFILIVRGVSLSRT